MTHHTPTPFAVTGTVQQCEIRNFTVVSKPEEAPTAYFAYKDDAERFVRAVNSHEALVEACQGAWTKLSYQLLPIHLEDTIERDTILGAINELKQALVMAGESPSMFKEESK